MLFRIEDTYDINSRRRAYDDLISYMVDKKQIDMYIAGKIRDEVNGSNNRELLSYSKSLATCILKYNKYMDNELHICSEEYLNYISYISQKHNHRCKYYCIDERLNETPLFYKSGEIELVNFVIDVSDNDLIDKYLRKYTGVGKKIIASPEKDNEVVVMNPPNDIIVKDYISAVYTLYALQLKYHFLCRKSIRNDLILELEHMEDFRFQFCPNERIALIILVDYLSSNWNEECRISQQIYQYSAAKEHLSLSYDPILQFYYIKEMCFMDSYNIISHYDDNVVSNLFWNYCGKCKGYF